MRSKNRKETSTGFFCRKVFMEQMALLETPAQFMELFQAAFAFIDNEDFEIKNNIVKMAFSSWKIALNYDKEYHKERQANSIKANEAKRKKRGRETRAQAEQTDEDDTAPPSNDIPLADVEEVEQYPFEEFWQIYGKEVGFEECQRVWNRQFSNETKAEIMAHVVEYVQARPNAYFRKDPINYFKDRCWKDKVIINPQTASSYGDYNGKSYKEAEFERNARTIVENLQAADRGELAYLSPFNEPNI